MQTDIIGWVSSCVLIATIGVQIRTQIRDNSSRGVSPLLFIGEIVSAAGFLTYSVLLGIPVYIVTNSIMILSSIVGLAVTLYHRNRS